MAYVKQTWTNKDVSQTTPIGASRLNYMENGIFGAWAAADQAQATADDVAFTLGQADNRYALKSEIPPDWPVYADVDAANAAIADGTLTNGAKLIILDAS